MTDVAWIGAALTAARPQAVAALLRYFRDLDVAEEALRTEVIDLARAVPEAKILLNHSPRVYGL